MPHPTDPPPAPSSSADPVERLIADCLDRPAAERTPALERACREHPQWAGPLRERAALLIAIGALDAGPERDPFPERLGDFRLLERLGGGGMGVVYRARQESLGRDVAVKLIRPGDLYFPGARERFRREVEAVARLDHPGIVPIYTVGEEQGVPYFAMERVRGASLAQVLAALSDRLPESLDGDDLRDTVARLSGAADEDAAAQPDASDADSDPDATADAGGASSAATARQRSGSRAEGSGGGSGFRRGWTDTCLDLVRQAALALHHAHERGLVHRDVKPSNILVTPDGRARLLDFGLTRAEGAESMTATGAAVGTLQYMPPEQLRGAEVDRRADVYALGVTLYELLALDVPFRGHDRGSTEEAIRDGKRVPLRHRNRRVPEDVEVVCETAMAWHPGSRYASAAELADDLTALLERRAIAARPPGPLTHLARWARRRPGLAAASGALLLLLTLVVVQQARHAADLEAALQVSQREAETSRRVVQLLTAVFEGAGPDANAGEELSASALLERGLASVRADLADEPLAAARLLTALGRVTHQLGHGEQAVELLEEAGRRYRELDAPPVAELCDLALAHAKAIQLSGDLDGAADAFRDAIETFDRVLPTGDPLTVRAVSGLAMALAELGRTDEARAQLGARIEEVAGRPDSEALLVEAQGALGLVLIEAGEAADAEPLLRGYLAHLRATHTAAHPVTARTIGLLGLALRFQDRYDEAEEQYGASIAMLMDLHRGDHPDLAEMLSNLATLYQFTGRLEEAERGYREALDMIERVAPDEHVVRSTALGNLAGLLLSTGRMGEARPLLLELAPLQEQLYPDGHPVLGHTHGRLAITAVMAGDFEAAVASGNASADAFLRSGGDGAVEALQTRRFLGGAFSQAGRADLAAEQCVLGLADADVLDADAATRLMLWALLGEALLQLDRRDEAIARLTAAADWLDAAGDRSPEHAALLNRLIELCVGAGRDDDAERQRQRLAAWGS